MTLNKDKDGEWSYAYVEDAHLIIDQYYGERLNNTTHDETYYSWNNKIAVIQRRAKYCSVEIHPLCGALLHFSGRNDKSATVLNAGEQVKHASNALAFMC